MKNVTITLDEDVSDWSKIRAAKDKTSVSKWIGNLLKQKMQDESGYDQVKKQFLNTRPVVLKNRGSYPSRDDIYER